MRKRTLWVLMSVLVAVVFTVAADDHDMHHSKVQSTPQWEQMKTLVGEWEGTMEEGGQKLPAKTSFRMTGDGSAILNALGEGSPWEMVTMFHTDGTRLMATHYCAAHNQPRFKSVATKNPNQIAFEFLDVTNAAPGDSHMSRVVLTFDGPDHHTEDWTSSEGGKESTGHFDFHRAKKHME